VAHRETVTLRVNCTTEGGQTVIRLASPTGRTLVLPEGVLRTTMYRTEGLLGRGGQVTLPRATMEALSKLGTIEQPEQKETPDDSTR
jgi:hypothetical protein